MRKIVKLVAGGAAGLTLALALVTGSGADGISNAGLERISPPADVSYGPVAALPAERVTAPADVSYGLVAAGSPDRVFAPAL